MLNKVIYLKWNDIVDSFIPYEKQSFLTLYKTLMGIETEASFEFPPVDTALLNKVMDIVFGRFYEHACCKFIVPINYSITNEDVQKEIKAFFLRLMGIVWKTYEYYGTLLTQYDSAKTHLMDDITATSSAKVKFNDTPQASNVSETYEGDSYITNFTKSEGETSSPLMSKMMRLKEIQDNYRNVLNDWVNEFERAYFQEEVQNYD